MTVTTFLLLWILFFAGETVGKIPNVTATSKIENLFYVLTASLAFYAGLRMLTAEKLRGKFWVAWRLLAAGLTMYGVANVLGYTLFFIVGYEYQSSPIAGLFPLFYVLSSFLGFLGVKRFFKMAGRRSFVLSWPGDVSK